LVRVFKKVPLDDLSSPASIAPDLQPESARK
jgi:hypothetical protein